ncbi:Probable poly(beta-D-mannuronate) O-acetylase [Citrifermentans bremense]|uniref:Probable poly(Beta-D-mannuronate) O-acetylase n=1 Tax=Citrifermentans bremense TaxID=60035 RepID=A0A6S6M6Z1_9BACT|nr:MBOAT family protein [Citrifermentans bremense]BCG47626.1 Probable poly(beta-D-mannuronate) O-acetylase [Citrifermentans bremense]
MSFASLPFILFCAACVAVFCVTPAKWRWLFLLATSYSFYATFKVPYLLLVLLMVTLICYGCGLLLQQTADPKRRLLLLWGGIAGNLSLLLWMRYLPFVSDNLNGALGLFSLDWRLPSAPQLVALGVSYYVFQGISYLVDVYLEVIEPERHLGYYALSLCFFPKLVQGPIERSGNLLWQLHELGRPSLEMLRSGVNLFIWGALKKVVVADRLAAYVDPVYGNVHGYHGLALLFATYLFALQIYFDFSGYTDMALGVGRLFGVRLTQNFNAPYLATSTADFWRRWHISFSSWILDYIFKPLQFSLRDWPRWGVPVALLTTFLISGLWHGPSWCFITWGGIHGVYLAAGVLSKKRRGAWSKRFGIGKSPWLTWWQRLVTFNMVCFSWVFFRATTIDDALYVAYSAVADLPQSLRPVLLPHQLQQLSLGKPAGELLFTLVLTAVVGFLGYWDLERRKKDPEAEELGFLQSLPLWGQGGAYGVILYLITICGVSAKGFIYQQF